MSKLKTKMFAAILSLAVGSLCQLQAGMGCFENVKIGADYLYWQTCGTGQDFAVVAEDGDSIFDNGAELKTHHLPSDWHSGYRVYAKADKVWCDWNAGVAYTHFKAHDHKHVSRDVLDSVILSTSLPTPSDLVGNEASSKWTLHYNLVDAFVSTPLNIYCDPRFEVEAFSGVQWLEFKENRQEFLEESLSEVGNGSTFFNRHLKVSGVGPSLGIHSAYTFCDCIKIFGKLGGSVIIAESKSKDHELLENEFGDVFYEQSYKNRDECVCFSGIHLATGVTYETCYCNMEIALRLGWEYVEWINAPDFPSYEFGAYGTRSSIGEKNLAFQGIFAGANITF